MPRHPSSILKIKIKQPYSTSLSSPPPPLSLSLFLTLSLSPPVLLSHSLSLWLIDWLNKECSEHTCTFCIAPESKRCRQRILTCQYSLVQACSKHSSFSQSVSIRDYYIYYDLTFGEGLKTWHIWAQKGPMIDVFMQFYTIQV